ncbi:MAG: peptidoglycan-associated lipoprotein Pal [Bacteriovoracaceae bacterium]|nr:peptidoglycan-associated lipoprotein Pal [Bacteriovoracaceae bacterium]
MKALHKKSFFSILLLTATLIVTGCSSTAKKDSGSTSDSMVDDNASQSALELNGSSDENTAGPLKTIYFAFDSARLTETAKETLNQNAMWLKGAENVDIQIEGHCDERGGQQYNLALGESRAKTVKKYLETLGVSSDRMSIISYGKEKPVAYGHDEEAWSKNRRSNFVVTAK